MLKTTFAFMADLTFRKAEPATLSVLCLAIDGAVTKTFLKFGVVQAMLCEKGMIVTIPKEGEAG